VTGSPIGEAYGYFLSGEALVNGREPLLVRALRHGDQVQIGRDQFTYLDFAPAPLPPDSALRSALCSAQSNCWDQPARALGDDEAIACPWCGKVYHSACWMSLEHCVTGLKCYPVRRALLAEFEGRVKVEELKEEERSEKIYCAADCKRSPYVEIDGGLIPISRVPEDRRHLAPSTSILVPPEKVIRCANCRAPYHPGCWLATRGDCSRCGFDIGAMIRRQVFKHVEERRR
jgi:hypothetical protein